MWGQHNSFEWGEGVDSANVMSVCPWKTMTLAIDNSTRIFIIASEFHNFPIAKWDNHRMQQSIIVQTEREKLATIDMNLGRNRLILIRRHAVIVPQSQANEVQLRSMNWNENCPQNDNYAFHCVNYWRLWATRRMVNHSWELSSGSTESEQRNVVGTKHTSDGQDTDTDKMTTKRLTNRYHLIERPNVDPKQLKE